MTDTPDPSRRDFAASLLGTAATLGLLRLALGSRALAAPALRPAEAWAAGIVGMARDLRRRALSLTQWQDAIAALNGRVPLEDLIGYLDLERVRPGLLAAGDGEQSMRIRLPEIDAGDRHIRTAIFSVPAGEAIIPHGHNNLLSAHLILQGHFHARTFARLVDEPGHMRLRPQLDADVGPGSTVTMSDDRDNVHWFVAGRQPVFTLDVVMHPPDLKQYQNPTERDRRVFVDPTGPLQADGTLEARVIDEASGLAKFGHAA